MLKIGVVCLARKTFDYNAAAEIYKEKIEELKSIKYVEFIFDENLVIEVEEAQNSVKKFVDVDGIVIISGTFHLGHLALIYASLKKPMLLWAFNELPYNGGKIRLNSVCGLNLNASNLYKAGYDNFHYTVGDKIDMDWINALKMKKVLENTRLGVVGSRAHGFFNLGIDELNLNGKAGTLIDYLQLDELFDYANNSESQYEEKLKEIYDVSGINNTQLSKVSKLIRGLELFFKEKNINAMAIRCWPEFASKYGISPCAAMSYLQANDYIIGCEGDVEGTLSMIATKAASNSTPFLADLSQVNLEENYALLWHCGVAAYNLWDKKSNRSLDTYFAGGKGVTADFVLKPGVISLLRIDSARGKTRLFIAKGEAVEMKKELKGTYAKVIFENHINSLLDTLVKNGVAHHAAMVYGDYMRTFEIFGQLMGWEIIRG
ncbi:MULTISPECIES: L-fucose/L-arabinose isomerase family protein [Marinitoga]|jgi:L-fucose isomerase-like protein|uniref:L-fucose isomerase C-terminal domain-containing protein n=1 Tax=Marinitoga aeolica TaxID=2809031 RepID=A0ABY8PSK5_9BACT|nr:MULTISPECIES: hypothetical protein [Marinitoga]MBM7558718.1 L-fucose isomerase-like protein [Marinitoga litoralis]WGS65621.1 hypothetical protein JRV97_03445 [Marinitoga aeolica]